MRVLILSPYPENIAAVVGHDAVAFNGDWQSLDTDQLNVSLIISYGYKSIIKEPLLTRFCRRIINIHIGYLPWNRGADPNFWSWFDGTPKGVSIHFIDEGIDTGDLLAQRETSMTSSETLRSSYEKLQASATDLLAEIWPRLRDGTLNPVPQAAGGSVHRRTDKTPYWSRLPLGYDTPVSMVEEMGAEAALSAGFWDKYFQEIEASRKNNS